MSVGADFSRTCEGCENIREEPGGKKKTVMYRCFAPGPCQGYHMGTTRLFRRGVHRIGKELAEKLAADERRAVYDKAGKIGRGRAKK